MFVKVSTYVAVVEELSIIRERAIQHVAENARLKADVDWLRTRVNQLEKERAILLREVSHLDVPIPSIEPVRSVMTSPLPAGFQLPSFEDVGDEEADRLGVAHDDEGRAVYQ